MALLDDINIVLRDFERYTGDGKPNAPVGHLPPIGDPRTGRRNIPMHELRGLLKTIAQTMGDPAALQEILDDMAEGFAAARPRESQINATSAAPVMLRVFASSAATPSQYMRIWLPVGGGNWAEVLLKRGSISTNPLDAGVSQVTWEPDEVRAKSDAVIFRVASTNVAGAWTTDNDVLPGIYARRSSDAGAARSFTFSGDFFRFGYVENVGSSAFQIEVDGKVAVMVPAGAALGRRVITRGGFGAGNHTLVVRRAAGATGSLWISGVGVSDSGGLSPEVADFAAGVDHPAGTFLAGGVQTFVASMEGGKRMGGGHGGTWSRTPTILTLDGLRLALEDTAGGYYAGREIVLTESCEMRQDAASAPTALVTRKMIFSGNGYSVDMDIRLPAPVQFRDFFWGMAKAGSAMTTVALPLSAPLSALPIATESQLVAFEGNGLRVEVDADGQIKSDGPDQYTYVADNEGVGKLYSVAALASPVTFTGRQRLRYSVRFMA